MSSPARSMQATLTVTLLVLISLVAQTALAEEREPAAQVSAMSGDVTAAGQAAGIRALQQNDLVYLAETVATGSNSRARLAFTDGGAITLRPASRLVIESYQYTGDREQDIQASRLVRGGIRAVTGLIGDSQPERYQVSTPVATIGIRGTDFRARYCQGDCLDLQHVGVDPPLDGLYTQTLVGVTLVGGVLVPAGQASYTNLRGITVILPAPPPILTEDIELQDSPASAAEDEDGAAAATVNSDAGHDDMEDRGALTAQLEAELLSTVGILGDFFDIPPRQASARIIECRP